MEDAPPNNEAPPINEEPVKNPSTSSVSSVVEEDPPDNGPWYVSVSNWLFSMYDRFDT